MLPKVTVILTARTLINRFGRNEITVDDITAKKWVEDGVAKYKAGFDYFPDELLVDNRKPDSVKRYAPQGAVTRVAWLQDDSKLGGAEISNQHVISIGTELGFEIVQITPKRFDHDWLKACDLIIINNFFLFNPVQEHFILALLYEYKKPYVKYEHDHREIIGDFARPEFIRRLFANSKLNVFISPFHVQNHREVLGDVVDPCFIMPPPVDTKLFKKISNIKRDSDKVISSTGRMFPSKGFDNIVKWAKDNSEKRLEVYTGNMAFSGSEKLSQLENVKVHDPVPLELLPEIYNSAGYVIHLPRALEAAGRILMEGYLCGCEPIMNDNVGLRSFNFDWNGSYDSIKYRIIQGPYTFWRKVEEHCD